MRSSPGLRLPEIEGILASRKSREVLLLDFPFLQINSGMESNSSLSFIFYSKSIQKGINSGQEPTNSFSFGFPFKINIKNDSNLELQPSEPRTEGSLALVLNSQGLDGSGESKTRVSLAL